MFRFLRPNLVQFLRRPYPLRGPRPTLARTTLATITVSFGALALQASSHDPTQPDPHAPSDPDQPPLASLLRAYFVFTLCSFPSLVDASPRILSFFSAIPVLRQVSERFLKVTFFDQFVGAETVDDCIPLLHNLRRSNQGVLLNYSVELPNGSSPNPNEPTVDPSQRALESTLHSIEIAGDFEESLPASASPTTGTWVAVKLSTLLPDHSALWVLSDWIVRQHSNTDPHLRVPFPGAPASQDLQHFLQSNDHNITQHIQSLRTLHANLRKICTRARDRGIKLTIDAEETWFQPAIDLFSVLLMQEFNSLRQPSTTTTSTGAGKSNTRAPQPLVYATLQAYLVRAPSFLDYLIKHAKENEYSLGVKLVRGAYIEAEADVHRDRSIPKTINSGSISPDENSPMYPNKESTDAAYDNCVRVLVGEIAKDGVVGDRKVGGKTSSTPGIGVLFGTHNWKSSRLVLDEIVKVGLGKEVVDSDSISGSVMGIERKGVEKKIVLSEGVRQRVCMAQLYGMSDSLAAYLVDRTSDQNTKRNQTSSPPFVIRYVPYGPLRDVMPYLARRAVENRSVLGPSAPSNDGPGTALNLMGKDLEGEKDRGQGAGGAVEERKRLGRMIRERVVGFWKF